MPGADPVTARAELIEAAAKAIAWNRYALSIPDEPDIADAEAALDALLAHPEALRAVSPPSEPSAVEVRIRECMKRWDGNYERGTYVADATDYGQVQVSIMRDIRFLLAALDALRGGAT